MLEVRGQLLRARRERIVGGGQLAAKLFRLGAGVSHIAQGFPEVTAHLVQLRNLGGRCGRLGGQIGDALFERGLSGGEQLASFFGLGERLLSPRGTELKRSGCRR